jgi:hypothetical protein
MEADMRTKSILAGFFSAAVLLGLASVASAQSEQIIFSGVGSGTFDNTPTPVGFWIWCQDENPGNPDYAGECAGSMYFYGLGLTKGVAGEVEESGEAYIMTVASRKGPSISCQLENVPPVVQGPHNTVNITCVTPSGTGTSETAVVNVTGPEE